MGKKPKVDKIKKEKKFKVSSIFFFLISFILTVFIFMGLIVAENRLSGKTVYVDALVATKDIPENEIITEFNISEYFTLSKIEVTSSLSDALTNAQSLIGKKTLVPFVKGEIILEKDFLEINRYTENFKNPVQIAVDVASLANIAGGIIREGDLINISVSYETEFVPENNGYIFPYTSVYVIENVYVAAAMNGNGEKIPPSDTKTGATLLLLTVEKETETILSNALINGSTLRISKVLNPEKLLPEPTKAPEPTPIPTSAPTPTPMTVPQATTSPKPTQAITLTIVPEKETEEKQESDDSKATATDSPKLNVTETPTPTAKPRATKSPTPTADAKPTSTPIPETTKSPTSAPKATATPKAR